jgi:hypothetical protein
LPGLGHGARGLKGDYTKVRTGVSNNDMAQPQKKPRGAASEGSIYHCRRPWLGRWGTILGPWLVLRLCSRFRSREPTSRWPGLLHQRPEPVLFHRGTGFVVGSRVLRANLRGARLSQIGGINWGGADIQGDPRDRLPIRHQPGQGVFVLALLQQIHA